MLMDEGLGKLPPMPAFEHFIAQPCASPSDMQPAYSSDWGSLIESILVRFPSDTDLDTSRQRQIILIGYGAYGWRQIHLHSSGLAMAAGWPKVDFRAISIAGSVLAPAHAHAPACNAPVPALDQEDMPVGDIDTLPGSKPHLYPYLGRDRDQDKDPGRGMAWIRQQVNHLRRSRSLWSGAWVRRR